MVTIGGPRWGLNFDDGICAGALAQSLRRMASPKGSPSRISEIQASESFYEDEDANQWASFSPPPRQDEQQSFAIVPENEADKLKRDLMNPIVKGTDRRGQMGDGAQT